MSTPFLPAKNGPTGASKRAETLFHEALDLPPGEREAFLREACGPDASLRAEVDGYLHHYEQAGSFLKEDSSVSPELEAEFARLKPEEVGERIGPYKLLEQIGEGGFGTVWVAEQEKPIRRRVALKIIKLGMDTKEVIARFEQERQALAMMDHPNIAKVLDAGATAHGRPFFAMELVRGLKITDYCDDKQLSTAERIELFITVCQAVQHAHQKGIIHRDLKPSNILVTINDGKAVPKVIDFGVAKATQGRLVEQTVYTQFQQMIGTPLYMSPEQAELTSLDIDTRSDIYSLGVLLYELLTGHTPIDQNTLARLGMDEIRRIIREIDPPRPSLRMKTLAAVEMTTAAKRRNIEPAKLSGALRDDLDWIVMKCIEKDRARRYDTANSLARDLERHLRNEVITARPPTTAYLLSKLIRRHKLTFAAAAAITVSLVIGIAASLWQAKRARDEGVRAGQAASQAKAAEERVTAALDELRTTAPAFAEQARSLASRERFDEAIEKLDYAIKLHPEVAEYLVAKGDLLQCQFKLAAAAAIYREALRVQPGLARAETSAKLCDELLAAEPGEQGKLTRESLAKLHLAMQQQQRPAAELMPVARLLGEEKKLLIEYWLTRLKDLPVSAERPLKERLTVREDGRLALDLWETKVTDLSPLTGAPLAVLNVGRCNELADLSPLRGLGLIDLDINTTSVTDLSPLREMHTLKRLYLGWGKVTDLSELSALRLEDVNLDRSRIFDLAPLRGMKLKKLSLRDTRVADLSPLAGMPLTFFDATAIPAVDFSPLAGAPLEKCNLQSSPVRDLSFLQNSPVKDLVLYECNEARGFGVLARLKSLDLLVLPQSFRSLPEEELAAIGALRAHPTLKNIQTEERSGGWSINTTQSKDIFWQDWDRERALTAPLRESGFKFTLNRLPSGLYRLEIKEQPFSDLSFLKDAPIEELILVKTRVSDLRPLEGLALTELDIGGTRVIDLTPLRAPVLSASLRRLYIWQIPARDFSPLAACTHLEFLDAPDTALADLEVVRGLKLREALFARSRIEDISALAGMPLERVTIHGTRVTDLRPLLQCPTLKDLVLPSQARAVNALRTLPWLVKLSFDDQGGFSKQKAEDFWLERDHDVTAEAVSSLSEASVRKPNDTSLALKVAALQAWFGMDADYAATSQRMLDWAKGATKLEDFERVAKTVSMRAGGGAATCTAALALARKAREIGTAEYLPWLELALGMAEYRSGHYSAAADALAVASQAALSVKDENIRARMEGIAGFYRAMSLYGQGEPAEARALFTATAKTRSLPADEQHPLADQFYPTDHDNLIVWLAYKEAGALMQMPLLKQARAVAAVLLPPTSAWKWLHPLDGIDPAESAPGFHTAFAGTAFDDSAWQTGQDREGRTGGFGYGDPEFDGVDIGTPTNGLKHSAYFRTRFTTDQPHANLELRCRRVDGIVVYLDGREVARDNMSDGPEAYKLPTARGNDLSEQAATRRIPLPGVSLAPGQHVLAISLHNDDRFSSILRIAAITLVELEAAPSPSK